MDTRSKEEFKKDIKMHHQDELEIVLRIAQKMHDKTDNWPTVEPCGTDYSGEFVEDEKLVTHMADFIIDDVPYEITKSAGICKRYFHEKEPKVRKAIKENYVMVFVNGIKTDKEPVFVAMDSKRLEELTQMAEEKYGTVGCPIGGGQIVGKKSYRYDINWFKKDWNTLPVLSDKTKKQYKQLLV